MKSEAHASVANSADGIYVLVMWKIRSLFSLTCIVSLEKVPVCQLVNVNYLIK